MGRKRKQKNKHLPKYVYHRASGKYQVKTYTKGKTVVRGTYDTPEEAEYMIGVKTNGHHWLNMPENAEQESFGFMYLITHKVTGKRYVGIKQFFKWSRFAEGGGYTPMLRTDADYEPLCWTPNLWEFYTSSSLPLNAEIKQGNVWDYTYEVIGTAQDKLELHLDEVFYMIENDVLDAKDEYGEYLWYNLNIAGCAFRPPHSPDEALSAKAKTEKEMKRYYVKPDLDVKGNVVPFEKRQAPCVSAVHPKTNLRGFTDVRS